MGKETAKSRSRRRILTRSMLAIALLSACSLPPLVPSQTGRSRERPSWAWGSKDMQQEPVVIEMQDEVTRRVEAPEDPSDSKKPSR